MSTYSSSVGTLRSTRELLWGTPRQAGFKVCSPRGCWQPPGIHKPNVGLRAYPTKGKAELGDRETVTETSHSIKTLLGLLKSSHHLWKALQAHLIVSQKTAEPWFSWGLPAQHDVSMMCTPQDNGEAGILLTEITGAMHIELSG